MLKPGFEQGALSGPLIPRLGRCALTSRRSLAEAGKMCIGSAQYHAGQKHDRLSVEVRLKDEVARGKHGR